MTLYPPQSVNSRKMQIFLSVCIWSEYIFHMAGMYENIDSFLRPSITPNSGAWGIPRLLSPSGLIFPGIILTLFFFSACSSQPPLIPGEPAASYLALGDSYTIGESVEAGDRWPAILARELEEQYPHTEISVEYRARTGWTTADLLSSLTESPPEESYDMVSLLIGVNNQFRGLSFSTYREDVPRLIALAQRYSSGGDILVLSIPDYSYTPYGGMLSTAERAEIQREIDEYNSWMENYCRQQEIPFVNITHITREGITNPALVAVDGLHPSAEAYSRFVDEIFLRTDPAALLGVN